MNMIEELNYTVCTLHDCNQNWYILTWLQNLFKICCWMGWIIVSGIEAFDEPRDKALGYFDTVWWIGVYALFYGIIIVCIYSIITFFIDSKREKLEAQIQYQARKACGYSFNLTQYEIRKSDLTRHLFLKLVMEIEITNPPILRNNIDFLLYLSRMQHLYQTEVII